MMILKLYLILSSAIDKGRESVSYEFPGLKQQPVDHFCIVLASSILPWIEAVFACFTFWLHTALDDHNLFIG